MIKSDGANGILYINYDQLLLSFNSLTHEINCQSNLFQNIRPLFLENALDKVSRIVHVRYI